MDNWFISDSLISSHVPRIIPAGAVLLPEAQSVYLKCRSWGHPVVPVQTGVLEWKVLEWPRHL